MYYFFSFKKNMSGLVIEKETKLLLRHQILATMKLFSSTIIN